MAYSDVAISLETEAETEDKPKVTIAEVIDREPRVNAHDVQWHGSNQLAVTISKQGSNKRVIRLLSRSGVMGDLLVEGQLASSSPDGGSVLVKTPTGWMLKDTRFGRTRKIPEPAGDSREFMAYHNPVWSSDGRYAVLIEHYRPSPSRKPGRIKSIGGVRVIDVGEDVPDGDQWSARLTIVDRFTPGNVSRTTVNGIVAGAQWDSGNSLFVSTTSFFGTQANSAVVRYNTGADNAQEIYRSPGRFQKMRPAVHPSGAVIALVLDVDNRKWSDFESILLIDPETGEEVGRLTHDIPVFGGDYAWSHQGHEIFARARNGGYDAIYAVPVNGVPRPLAHGDRRHFNMALSPDGKSLSYQTEDGYGRKDIRILNLETEEESIVYILDDPTTAFRLGEWRRIRWHSSDDVEPFGFIVFPPDFDPSQQYPMIVDVHGGGPGSRLTLDGPFTSGVARGPLERHAWAALGYIVFAPDYRSTGMYGPAVIAARYKTGEMAAVQDIKDIVSGTCHMIDRGYVDRDRISILGHSAGGQRAYVLLTRSDLYSAAILNEATPPDPVSNFIAFASGRYTGGYPEGILRHRYGGDLSDFPGRYKANYMFDSYKNKTPTLIMVGNEDLGGMQHMPGEILYSILQQRGVPSRLLKFVDEGHTFSRPDSAKVAFEQVRQWLETYASERVNQYPNDKSQHASADTGLDCTFSR